MAKERTRNYTSEVSRISTKSLKTLIGSPTAWIFTSGNKKLIAQVRDDFIHYKLPNGRIVSGVLNKTALSFGWRYWFICPYCQTRKSALYYTNKDIACRECFNLYYASQSESQLDGLRRKLIKKRDRLFKSNDSEYNNLFNLSCYFPKPKGISRKRFDREQAKLAHVESIYWRNANDYIDRLMPRLVKR